MDDYSNHEVLDRISLALSGLQDHVLGHDVVEGMQDTDPVRIALEEAFEALVRAYNAMGDRHLVELGD